MSKYAVLIPAALVMLASPTQASNPAVPQAPKLMVKSSIGRIAWSAQGSYYVKISGCVGEFSTSGSITLPAGTYCVAAVGAQNRQSCKTVVVY